MTDSLTQSDIDRIYGRLQEDVDLKKIKNKREFSKQIKDNPKTIKWTEKLNDFFWDIHTSKVQIEEEIPELTIPAVPREKLTPIEKRNQTIRLKSQQIKVNASYKQKSYTKNKGRLWIDSEITFAQRLRKDGLTYNQIGIQLNRSYSSVSTKLYRINKK